MTKGMIITFLCGAAVDKQIGLSRPQEMASQLAGRPLLISKPAARVAAKVMN